MSKSEAELSLVKYCMQLEKYGIDESIHSPNMALLRRKARKQMIELTKEDADHSKLLNRLWISGYYQPYQYFLVQNSNNLKMITLLTMFSGELHELLMFSDKYAAQLNLYIGDLHRYMPKDEIQHTLAARYYERSIQLDPKQGRTYFALSCVKSEASLAENLRLLLLSQMAAIPYNTNPKLADCLRPIEMNDEDELSADDVLSQFVHWAVLEKSSRLDHQKTGHQVAKVFKKMFEKQENADWPMILSTCRLASGLANRKEGFDRFLGCFEILTDFHLAVLSKNHANCRLLSESISWIYEISQVFNISNENGEPKSKSLSNFAKAKWNKLNDVVMEQINTVFSTTSLSPPSTDTVSYSTAFQLNGPKFDMTLPVLSSFVHKILKLPHPTIELIANRSSGEPLLRRINQSETRQLNVSPELIVKLREMVNLKDRGDWKPVYVIMDLPSIIAHPKTAETIWDLHDFICIVPTHVFAKMDDMKNSNRKIRPLIRSLTKHLGSQFVIRKKCENEVECAKELVAKIKETSTEGDYSHLVAVLCEKPKEQKALEGVSFYTIDEFYKKL